MKFTQVGAAVIALSTVTLSVMNIASGSVPLKGKVTDDSAIYQNLSEIRAQRLAKPDFDSDIERLARAEKAYQENLPLAKNPRLMGAMQRVAQAKYTPSRKTVRQ